MTASNFSEILQTGMNNPECSFYVGAFTGQWMALKYIIMLAVVYFIIKAADRLAFEPVLELIKTRLKRK